MKRKLRNWIESYLEYVENQEAPYMFHLWTALSILGAVAERNVWIDRGYWLTYPNLYVILVANSAICRKTTAMTTGISLLRQISNPPAVFQQKITPEALIQAMAQECKIEDGEVIKPSSIYIVAPELSTFIGTSSQNSSLIALLTDLYDCPDKWDYKTISRGENILRSVCINLLGASTPEWLRASIPADAVGGGFTSRVIFVHQDKVEKYVPFPELTEKQKRLKDKLIMDLEHIRSLGGEFKFGKEAKEWYESWYVEHMMRLENIDEAFTGYLVRKAELILKVAMLSCLAETDDRTIKTKDLEFAKYILQETEKELPDIIATVRASDLGQNCTKVEKLIRKLGKVPRSELLRRLSYCMSAKELNEVLDTLIQSGLIQQEYEGRAVVYKSKKDSSFW